ncbi:hypothetical protein [Uliginosibacterium sp. H1]|uniref:hypothetical protein n=1 Tax=Uliginosibacterium sp. H1 TaxID=3114757 RepID=UPI002E19299F|nr:hypothetical protein [Uliginosibacterium sp. H1]
MAIDWIAAAKLVPWSDVISSAPQLAKGARKLWERVGKRESAPPPAADAPAADPLAVLRDRVAQLEAEAATSSELIRSLAEQNAKLVQVLHGLRRWVKLLGAVSALLVITVAWLLWRVPLA